MTPRIGWMGGLLFSSGACALVYQTIWTRELRGVYGVSTTASAAVLAVFMGGLGAGAVLFGRRVERSLHPLRLYAALEVGAALAAALSLPALHVVRAIYVGLGGTAALGSFGGVAVRLLLTVIAVGVPAMLLGGTLPAAVKAVESDDDVARRRSGVLYGANTLGAVAGTLVSTFWMLEALGNRATLLAAVGVNTSIAAVAWWLASRPAAGSGLVGVPPPVALPLLPPSGAACSRSLIGAVAAVSGFAFFAMELVWFRMLGPLLGGTTYSFGLILAVALLGVGAGGLAYRALDGSRTPSMALLGFSCALEGLFLVLPYALGDRVALGALFLRLFGVTGFGGLLLGWAAVALLVVFPPALVAGFQFPLLVALRGAGARDVGRDLGEVYGWNTAGAVAGALAAGFGLMPLLTAPGLWRAMVLLLAVLSVIVLALARRSAPGRPLPVRSLRSLATLAVVGAAVLPLFLAQGPTAVWRHTGIGAGRHAMTASTSNQLEDWVRFHRRTVRWEREGRESSVAMNDASGISFLINGKVDGNAREDAATQVMGGLIGSALHRNPKRAMVIGLGTGSTAGWLAEVPTMEKVDVVELESAVLEVARACSPVNRRVLENPKVQVTIGDGREVLLTTRERYDIVYSEPSNPYRAGIAGLFTREFYASVSDRLEEDGIFLQWVQEYEVDGRAVRTLYATLSSVFPVVETWETDPGADLLMVASHRPLSYDAGRLRDTLRGEPYRSALAASWRTSDLEGFLAGFTAGDVVARELGAGEPINTDDRNLLEFAFARTLGRAAGFDSSQLRTIARDRAADRPVMARGELAGQVNWERVAENRRSLSGELAGPSEDSTSRGEALRRYHQGDFAGALASWRAQPREPTELFEIELVAESLAVAGDPAALPTIDRLRTHQPVEADALLGLALAVTGRYDDAAIAFEHAFLAYRDDPWPAVPLMARTLNRAVELGRVDRVHGERMFAVLEKPFAVRLLNEQRLESRLALAEQLGEHPRCLDLLAEREPFVPWNRRFLEWRRSCYRTFGGDVARADRDLLDFLAEEPETLLRPTSGRN